MQDYSNEERGAPHIAVNAQYIKDFSFENMKSAIILGSAMASFCVEKFGTQRLTEINQADIKERVQSFVSLVNFEIELV
jgi:hypothetical protein